MATELKEGLVLCRRKSSLAPSSRGKTDAKGKTNDNHHVQVTALGAKGCLLPTRPCTHPRRGCAGTYYHGIASSPSSAELTAYSQNPRGHAERNNSGISCERFVKANLGWALRGDRRGRSTKNSIDQLPPGGLSKHDHPGDGSPPVSYRTFGDEKTENLTAHGRTTKLMKSH